MSAILIVDDNPLSLRLMENVLRFEGYEAIRAFDGYEALEALSSGDVDMVITDINMPGMGGIELLKRIRQKGLSLPVIAISGDSDPHLAVHRGFDALISKPFEIDSVLDVVREVLNKT